jgi:predicted aspartyl protease
VHKLMIVAMGLVGCGSPAARQETRVTQPTEPPSACAGNAVLDGQGNLIVNGRWRDQPVRILVDTGANGGSISADLVAKHQLPVKGNAAYASATGQFVNTTVHDGGPIEIGGATVDAASFISQAAHMDSYDLAIGLDQLEPHAMALDLANQSFCLVGSPHPLAVEPMRVGGNAENRDIVVAATFGSVQLADMILDTGAGVTTVNDDLIAKLEHTELPERAQAIDGTGKMVELPLVTVPKMCVHGACAADHMVMPSPDLTPLVGHHVDGIVGLPFFADHVLVLDFPAKKLGIK